MLSTAFDLLVLLLLILLNGFFAMSELAILSSRRIRLKIQADRGSREARVALMLANQPQRILPTVQIGITIIGILAGAYGGATIATPLAQALAQIPLLERYAEAVALGIVVAGITYVSVILGELVPKQLALRRSEAIAVHVARPMWLLTRLTAPVVFLLSISSAAVLRLIGSTLNRPRTVTEEEVKALIAEGEQAGVVAPAERAMINRVLRLADRPVRSMMTPRRDVVWVDAGWPPEQIRRTIMTGAYSRFPVCRGRFDNVVGMLEAKGLLDQLLSGAPFDPIKAAQPPVIFPDRTSVLDALERIREDGIHIALVADEYGSLVGLITPTDILRAIVGELPESAGIPATQAKRRADGSCLIDGLLSKDEVKDHLGLHELPGETYYHTLAGFLLHRLGRVPQEGDMVDWAGYRFEVIDMDGRRIDKVLVTRRPGESTLGE